MPTIMGEVVMLSVVIRGVCFSGKTVRATGFNDYIIKDIDYVVDASSRRWSMAINFAVRL